MQASIESTPFEIKVLDISESGARFTCDQQLAVNLTLTINLAIDPITFPMQCLILWHKLQINGPHMYGCEFICPTPTEVNLIQVMVREALARQT